MNNKEQVRVKIEKMLEENRNRLKDRFDFIPPTADEIEKMESQLGIKLPETYIWAWSVFGGGIGDVYISFGKEGFDVVENTLESWKHLSTVIEFEKELLERGEIEETDLEPFRLSLIEPRTYIVIEDCVYQFAIDIASGNMIEIGESSAEKLDETYEMYLLKNLEEMLILL